MKMYDEAEQVTRREKLNGLRYGDQLELGWVFLAMTEDGENFYAVPDAYFFSGAQFGATTRTSTGFNISESVTRQIRLIDVPMWLEKGIAKTEARRPMDGTGAGWLPVSNHKENAA